jgi:hypothetical protein
VLQRALGNCALHCRAVPPVLHHTWVNTIYTPFSSFILACLVLRVLPPALGGEFVLNPCFWFHTGWSQWREESS